jgi:ribosome-binding ATPase YchF (GTP1/OBG family)
MLCASSPGKGKQFHPWLPQIKEKVSLLKEHAKASEIKEYFKKIYPSNVNDSDLKELADAYVEEHKRKMYLANKFPSMKIADIDLLSQLVTDEEIKQYEKDFGN